MKIITAENKITDKIDAAWGRNLLGTRLVEKMFSLVLGGCVFFNGVLNYLLGEIQSEGICLGLALIYFTTKIKLKSRFFIQIGALAFFIAINVNQILVAENQIRLLFLYPYLFYTAILLLPIYKDAAEINSDFLARFFVYFACISSAYAVAQRLGFEIVLPLESELRATGLSRSSLNLTGCLFSALSICVLIVKDGYKKIIIQLILFGGLVAAGGRGGMICGLVLMGLYYLKSLKNNKTFLMALVFLMLLVALTAGEHFYRAFSAFDFSDDQSNIDRLESYSQFFLQFDFWGGGVGSTSPAVMRFVDATGFESSVLNTIYELGVGFSLIFGLALFSWVYSLPNSVRTRICILGVAISPILIGQQLYGIPSAFVSLMFCVYAILSNRRAIIL